MSLWTLPLDAITFENVEEFCRANLPEGVNLDYKADIPTKLPKVVSSFANTTGGLIIFGVTTDDQNRPAEIVGVPNERGFSERVTEKCRDGINPPILPSMSPLLPLPSDSSKAVAVMRINQSPEAPHAIQNSTMVYVRRGDVSDCMDLADIDRIERMLHLRSRSDAKARFLRDRHYARFEYFTKDHSAWPAVWWNVAPLYPSAPVCSNDDQRMPGMGTSRRGPDGAWGLGKGYLINRDNQVVDRYFGTSIFGDFFHARRLLQQSATDPLLALAYLQVVTREMLTNVQAFFHAHLRTSPGMLRVSMGLRGVQGRHMLGLRGHTDGTLFPDEQFETDSIVTYEEFCESQFASPSQRSRVLSDIIGDVAHAFDLPRPTM